jgi:cell division protein FtsB
MNETLENGGQKTDRQDKIKFYVVVLLVSAIVGYTAFVLFQSIYFNYQASQKIKDLKLQFAELDQKKLSLEALIAYYQTDTFRELEARKKLGLKMPGEKVVKVEIEKQEEPTVPQNSLPNEKEKPNWQKWIDFLEGKNF